VVFTARALARVGDFTSTLAIGLVANGIGALNVIVTVDNEEVEGVAFAN
jgi:uncharacterized metal-binding protein